AHQKAVRYVAFSPKGGLVLNGSSDGTAALFEADTGKELQRITSEGEVNAVAFSHDGGLFAIGSSIKASAGPPGGMTRIFDTASGREMAHMIHARPARDVIFSSDDRLVAAAGEDHLIHVFRALDGTRMALISGDFIKAMRFTEDGVELQVVS